MQSTRGGGTGVKRMREEESRLPITCPHHLPLRTTPASLQQVPYLLQLWSLHSASFLWAANERAGLHVVRRYVGADTFHPTLADILVDSRYYHIFKTIYNLDLKRSENKKDKCTGLQVTLSYFSFLMLHHTASCVCVSGQAQAVEAALQMVWVWFSPPPSISNIYKKYTNSLFEVVNPFVG